MNQTSIVFSVVAAVSLLLAALLLNGLAIFEIPRRRDDEDDDWKGDSSSLEQDFRDILAALPLMKMRLVVDRYVRCDKQINDTIAFLNDQHRFICPELMRMPHVRLFKIIVMYLGFRLDYWSEEFRRFWNDLPKYEDSNSLSEEGGLTKMINDIARLVPKNEVHDLLCRKNHESRCFQFFLQSLKSPQFHRLCTSIQENTILQRNFHWARESGLEAVFAVELIGDLYVYLTTRVN